MNNDLPSEIYSTKPRVMRDYEHLKEKNLKGPGKIIFQVIQDCSAYDG